MEAEQEEEINYGVTDMSGYTILNKMYTSQSVMTMNVTG